MSAGDPRRLHYVPKGYLKFFAETGKKHVWCFDKKSKESNHSNVKSILFQWDYYTIPDGMILDDLAVIENAKGLDIERFFESLEREFPKTIRTFIDDAISDKPVMYLKNQEFIAKYMYFQMVRTKDFERTIRDAIFMLSLSALDLANRHTIKGERISKDLMPAIASRIADKKASDPRLRIISMFSKESYKIIFNRFLELNWTLLICEDNSQFITSDHPIHNLSGKDGKLHGLGMQDVDIEVFFPLTPMYALVLNDPLSRGRNNLREFNIRKIEKKYVDEYNRLQIIRAERFIISKTDIGVHCSEVIGNRVNAPHALLKDWGSGLDGGLVEVNGQYKYLLLPPEDLGGE
ncbi:DUF4238 domain-containing protein (plasmid) [Deinococcus sp. D7000]|nr:DUF4238 domain-containing protein [Deinococcus sp. D7000]